VAAGESFPKRLRLLRGTEFQRVFQESRKTGDQTLTVLGRPNGQDYARLGMVVSRKSVPLAVARNCVRRLIRESFRRHQRLLAGLDVIVLGRRGCDGRGSEDLRAALERCWRELVRKCEQS
jgi:ribonuclease P protein component